MIPSQINKAHGSGGRLMMELIDGLFMQAFANPYLNRKDDGAVMPSSSERMVMTTDAYVVTPLFFPGGDIGSLAVNGTVNDLAMMGAVPQYLAVSFIIEEGLELGCLQEIVQSMALAAKHAAVSIVTGDTKVVEKGGADQLFITTTGVGFVPSSVHLSGENAKVGDVVLISGPIAAHGMAVMAQRERLQFEPPIQSDTRPLNHMIQSLLKAYPEVHVLRDPTRGGLATTLNEIAIQSKVGIEIDESSIPIADGALGACELLGLDPLYVANEGLCVVICPPAIAAGVLQTLQQHPDGKASRIIGKVTDDNAHWVQMRTALGGARWIDMPRGEQLPRIC